MQANHLLVNVRPQIGDRVRPIARAWSCLLLAVCLLGGCPGKDAIDNNKSARSQQEPVAAATLAYIGNFRGFQRPCGCDQRQDGGLLRLATVVRVLRGELTAEQAMIKAGELSSNSHGGSAEQIRPVASVPGMQAAEQPTATTAPGAGAQATEPALPVEPPAGAVLDPLWLIDCGNFTDEANRLPGFRAASHLKALALLQARAAVLGRSEARLSSEQALMAFRNSPIPLLSCNLQSTLPEIKVQRSLELAPGWHLIGLTETEGSESGGFASGGLALRRKLGGHNAAEAGTVWASVSDPLAALTAELDQLPAGSRVIVACAQLPAGLLSQIKALGPAVIIGAQQEADFRAHVESLTLPAVLSAPVRRGLLATFVSLRQTTPGSQSGDRAIFWSYRLATGIQDDPAMDELLKSEDRESLQVALSSGNWKDNKWGQDESFLPPEMRQKGSVVAGYIGSSVCMDCHPAEHAVWEKTGHQHAFETLIRHDNGGTLDCLECHVTGLLEPGGFLPASAQPQLAAVGCESCHGPGGAHVGLAQQLDPALLSAPVIKSGKLPAMERRAIQRGDLANCVYCHDDFNSPGFRLEEYWPKVQH